MITLARITLYPFKSLDPFSVDASIVLASGALEHDRRFALRDRAGAFINGKRDPRIHGIRTKFDIDDTVFSEVFIRAMGVSKYFDCFDTTKDRAALEAWFTNYFEAPVTIAENRVGGFPDDTEYPGPTVISTATLETVASWF